MESSAPKRRRTSPRAAALADSGNNAESTTPPDPPPAGGSKSQRPSFASPTKASLSRHNPEILSRRRPASRGREEDAPSASRPTSRGSDENLSAMLDAQLERRSETGIMDTGTGMERLEGESNVGQGEPKSALPESSRRSPIRKIGGSMAAKPKRTPNKPNPRPLPPPGPDDDEDILDPGMRRSLRRQGLGVLLTRGDAEPELPPTPEHPDPEFTTPPSGIHNTPSKRPRRDKSLAERIGSSPLKPQPRKPQIVRRGSPPQAKKRSGSAKNEKGKGKVGQSTKAARGIKPLDPDADKTKLRDSLLVELRQLEHDLEVATTENERIRQARLSQLEVSPPDNSDELLDVLRRHGVPPEVEEADATTKWLRAALNPMAFLPFAKSSSSSLLLGEEQAEEEEKPPISHHPISMTAEEELPYLQTFTPLSLSSNVAMLTQQGPGAPLLQKHSITATTSNPAGVFAARIEMTVNTKTLAVTELAVPRLDPSAAPELSPFIRSVVNQTNPNSALTNNISVLAWAMAEWVRVAMRRAKVWHLLEEQLGSKDALAESVAAIRARKKRKRTRRDAGQEDDEDGQVWNNAAASAKAGDGGTLSQAELLPHMGRTSMDLDIPAIDGSEDEDKSGLRVQWRIEFDWTGEAQSRIGVLLGVPGKCELYTLSRRSRSLTLE